MNTQKQNEKELKACMRLLVSGQVQGVFFRATAQKQAEQLGLTGYAHNLADGCVEVVACGHPLALEKLEHWLSQEPEAAEVNSVVSEVLPPQEFLNFSTG